MRSPAAAGKHIPADAYGEYEQWLHSSFDDAVSLQSRCFPDELIRMERTGKQPGACNPARASWRSAIMRSWANNGTVPTPGSTIGGQAAAWHMPFEPQRDHVGHKIDTLSLCAVYQTALRFECRVCNHWCVVPAIPIWWLFERRGWPDGLHHACKRFYCSHCLSRKGKKIHDPHVRVTGEKPSGDPFAWPDERTWLRMARRFKG